MEVQELSKQLSGKTIVESLKELVHIFPGKVVFSTSFGIEDQVITYYIFRNEIPIDVITLDTGRLFPETYRVFTETHRKYRKNIKTFFPDREAVEKIPEKLCV